MKSLIFSFIFFLGLFSCSSKEKQENTEPLVLLSTTEGLIKIKLYNDTPLHRDNFLKLVNDSYYNGTLFHRVMKDFMIQGGDPDSRLAGPGDVLGNSGPGYTIEPEFRPGLFHKKGALAAARQSDQLNPDKRSSGSQFYLVQGKVLNDQELDQLELRINNMMKQASFFKFINEEKEAAQNRGEDIDMAKIQEIASLKAEELYVNMEAYKIPPAQREVYKTLGGTPHLDQNYTVFGEIVEGFDVLDKIASVQTDDRDRPIKDIRIISVEIVKK